MSMIANPSREWDSWDYITGNSDMSIVVDRYYHLYELNNQNDADLKIAAKDPQTGAWTKWIVFPGILYSPMKKSGYFILSHPILEPVLDVHRSVLENEIVIESDYMCKSCTELKKLKLSTPVGCLDCYGKNYEATKIMGAIMERKGFIPHYYYSGNKSIHTHIFLDFKTFNKVDLLLADRIMLKFKSRGRFLKKFMEWLRNLMIRCWDTGVRQFDEGLAHPTHLIRSELSKNKTGFKTFLGYHYKDLSFIPYICNEQNRIYPKLGKVKVSGPKDINELMEEFMKSVDDSSRKKKVKKREASLHAWINPGSKDYLLRPQIKYMMSDDFKVSGDGMKRAMFILANELKVVFGKEQAIILLKDWNRKMGDPIKEGELEYRVQMKEYTLSDEYIDSFLKSIGINNIKKKPSSE